MESKEALKQICTVCERHLGLSQKRCPFRSISNEYCDEYNGLFKDLDRLEKQDKALELVKTKRVDITNDILTQQDYDWYMDYAICHDFISAHLLTRDEFNLLKEVFG